MQCFIPIMTELKTLLPTSREKKSLTKRQRKTISHGMGTQTHTHTKSWRRLNPFFSFLLILFVFHWNRNKGVLRDFERNIFWSGWFIVSNSVFVYIATTENYLCHNSTNKMETESPQSARTAEYQDAQNLSCQPMRGLQYRSLTNGRASIHVDGECEDKRESSGGIRIIK